jgi:hypothetical protein
LPDRRKLREQSNSNKKMNQTIIYSTLPKGRLTIDGISYLDLSLHCSIRLSHHSATTMNLFPEILEWAGKIKDVQGFRVQWNNAGASEAQADLTAIEPSVWESLVHSNIKVSAFIEENKSKARIHAYPISEIGGTILDMYREFGVKSPLNLIQPGIFIQKINPVKAGRYSLDQQALNNYIQITGSKTSGPDIRNSFRKINATRSGILEKNTQSGVMKDYQTIMSRANYAENRKRNSEPGFQFTRFRDFHRLDRDPGKVLRQKIDVPEFEFHDILSQIGNYPQLQRKVGLVIDIRVPVPDGVADEGVISAFPYGLVLGENSIISVTATAYRLTGNGFFARERPGEETDFHNGFIRLNTGEFSINQIDTDSVVLQTINKADSHIVRISEKVTRLSNQFLQMTPDEEKVDDLDDEKNLPADKAEGLPVIRSAGISIIKNNMEEYLGRRFLKSFEMNLKFVRPRKESEQVLTRNLALLGIPDQVKTLSLAINSTEVLYANDLIAGYRLDVAYSDKPDKWYSLHHKHDEITCFDKDMNPVIVTGVIPDEGFCQIAVTGDNDDSDDLFVSGVIARWTGWSLAVERPGFPIDEAGDELDKDHVLSRTEEQERKYWSRHDSNIRMNVKTGLVPGTLPRLRYGQAYNLRMRCVDIAGNSVSPDAYPDRPAEAIITDFTYLRYEPVASPPVFPASRLKAGEDIERLVIKSKAGMPANGYKGADVTDESRFPRRIFMPPQVSQQMAEQHGKFDAAFVADGTAAQKFYELIASRETPPGAGEPADRIYSAESFAIRYLPDPVAAGVAFFLAEGYDNTHTQDFKPQHIRFIPSAISRPSDDWLNPVPITISLMEGEATSEWDGKSTLTFFLPKGHRAKIRYSCFWDKAHMQRTSGIRNNLSRDRGFSSVSDHLQNGRHWMVSPFRELELIHATEQPVSGPELENVSSERGYLDTPAWLKMRIRVHGQSTNSVSFEAGWEEWDDNPLKPLPEKISNKELLDPVQINYKDQIKQVGFVPSKNPDFSVINLNVPARKPLYGTSSPGAAGRRAVSLGAVLPGNQKTMSLINFFTPAFITKTWGIMHGFPDTRHRFVDYTPLASSRYGEFFRKDGTMENPDTFLKGKSVRINILSSDRPLPPEVEYIIPTFNWHKTGEKDRQTHVRQGGSLRIYLKRPWFSSGEGEMLAAVLHPGSPAPDESSADNVIYTQWGTDPIYPLPGGRDLFLGIPDFQWQAADEKDLVYAGMEDLKASVVVFPVKFDAERKLWYADLTIKTKNRYFPFVKLMLSRFQKNSLRISNSDVCLSPVVETDFIQLLPERKVQLLVERRGGRANRIMVQISGSGYRGFNNTFEINIFSEDIPQPLSGIISNAIPRRGARGQQAVIGEIQYPGDYTFIATGFLDITPDLRDHPFNVVVLEYDKEDPDGNRRLVFSDEFSCSNG